MAGLPRYLTEFEFLALCRDEETTVRFCMDHELLCNPDTVQLNPGMCLIGTVPCNGEVRLTHYEERRVFYCPVCVKRRSYKNRVRNGVLLRKGEERGVAMSPIGRFNGPTKESLLLVYYWSTGMLATEARDEIVSPDFPIGVRAVQEFFHHLNVLAEEKLQNAPPMVVHSQSSIQIDEALFKGKNKAHRGRPLQQDLIPGARARNHGDRVDGPWVFGLCCRDLDNNLDLRMFVVNRRDEATLRPIVLRHASPGSTIQSDEWGGYLHLSNWGGVANFNHLTVTHEYHFVDPMSGANTQLVEGTWKHAKEAIMHARYGVKGNTQAHLAHYWFRKKHRNYAFTAALEMIAERRPVVM